MIDDGVVLGIVKGETGLSPSLFHFQETPWPGSCQSVGAQIRFPTERRMPLTPSQRVTLLREISTRLSAENWSLIDATLKQFSLPWTDSWNGTLDAYVLRMTEDAPDQALIDLAQHVVFQFEQATPLRVDPQFWRKGMLRLFISHLATYKVFAADLQAELLSYGISSFVAHSDIEPTSEWQTQIETALASCEALVALLHEKFHESKWADQEIGFAMGRGGARPSRSAWARRPTASSADSRLSTGTAKSRRSWPENCSTRTARTSRRSDGWAKSLWGSSSRA